MKFLRKLGVLFLFVAALFGGIAFLGPQVIEKPVAQTFIHKVITTRVMDAVVEIMGDNATSDELLEIQNSIDDNKYIVNVADEYVKAVKKLSLEKGTDFSKLTTDDLKNCLDETAVDKLFNSFGDDLFKKLTDGTDTSGIIGQITTSIYNSMMPSIIKAVKEVTNDGFITSLSGVDNKYTLILYIYSFITSVTMQIIVGALTVLGLILAFICHNNKCKALFNVGIVGILTGIIWLAIAFLSGPLYTQVSNRLAGRSVSIDAKMWIIYGAALTVVGAIFFIIGAAANGRNRREKENNTEAYEQ